MSLEGNEVDKDDNIQQGNDDEDKVLKAEKRLKYIQPHKEHECKKNMASLLFEKAHRHEMREYSDNEKEGNQGRGPAVFILDHFINIICARCQPQDGVNGEENTRKENTR